MSLDGKRQSCPCGKSVIWGSLATQEDFDKWTEEHRAHAPEIRPDMSLETEAALAVLRGTSPKVVKVLDDTENWAPVSFKFGTPPDPMPASAQVFSPKLEKRPVIHPDWCVCASCKGKKGISP